MLNFLGSKEFMTLFWEEVIKPLSYSLLCKLHQKHLRHKG